MSETVTIPYPEPSYAIFEATLDDLPVVAVVNETLLDFAHKDLFPFAVSITIEASATAEQGMPTSDECGVLDALGDEIEDSLIRDRNCIYVARQTWSGLREYLYYANNPERAKEVLEKLIQTPDPVRPWSYQIEPDSEWEFASPYFDVLRRGSDA